MTTASSLDLVARRVTATSLAYYALDVSLVKDSEFDRWCSRLHDEWEDLSKYWQWKLGNASDIRASGFHIKCVARDVAGTIAWLRSEGQYRYRLISNPTKWRAIPKAIQKLEGAPQGVSPVDYMVGRWTTVDNFGWNHKEPIQ